MTGEGRFELERAITQSELELHYQPIFSIDGKTLRGVEALDTVKLGREITGHALDDPRAEDMARGIARFASARGIALIAVGVQNKAMLGFAQALGRWAPART